MYLLWSTNTLQPQALIPKFSVIGAGFIWLFLFIIVHSVVVEIVSDDCRKRRLSFLVIQQEPQYIPFTDRIAVPGMRKKVGKFIFLDNKRLGWLFNREWPMADKY